MLSNDPAGACPAESDEVKVTIYPKPLPPVPTVPPQYCVGASIDLISASGSSLKWYNASMTQISTGAQLAPPVLADGEKRVSFFVTQTEFTQSPFPGCESLPAEMIVIINPNPVASFTAENFCLGEDMQFTDQSSIAQPAVGSRTIVSWQWDFDDAFITVPGTGFISDDDSHGGRTGATFENPTHQYDGPGEYTVRLNVTTSDGCIDSYDILPAIKVGPVPVADFTFANLCDQDATSYTYSGTEQANINSWSWDFGDPGSGTANNQTIDKPSHTFTGVGTYDVTLSVRTALGCEDVVTKKTSILPYIQTFPYIQNFENNSHGWVAEGLNTNGFNSWAQLTSAGNLSAKAQNGPNFWVTQDPGTGTYSNLERSVLNGPCVNVQALERPVLSFDYFNNTEVNADGAYIEYSSNNGATWTVLGNINEGLDWYNKTAVQGLAAQNGVGQNVGQVGWSGSTATWTTGKYNLDGLAGDTKVRFRFVFGSNPSSPIDGSALNGFAVDYFKLETRNRLVLVENFTNANAQQVAGNNENFRIFPNVEAANEVVKIQYHTAFPASDPINAQNPADPNARSTFYGVTTSPKAYIDGSSQGSFLGNWASDYYKTQSLVSAPISITINNPTTDNGTLNISGSIMPIEMDLNANEYSLYIAVVERQLGNNVHVLRKMLPSAAGQKVSAVAINQTMDFSTSWVIDQANVTDPDQLAVIAFVQADAINPITGYRSILQAAINTTMPEINFNTGIDLTLVDQVTVFPNPADNELNILLPAPAKHRVDIRILDQLGKPVIRTKVNAGDSGISISTRDLAGSVYIVQFEENGAIGYRKVVISH
jgi:PKD repeat protein